MSMQDVIVLEGLTEHWLTPSAALYRSLIVGYWSWVTLPSPEKTRLIAPLLLSDTQFYGSMSTELCRNHELLSEG